MDNVVDCPRFENQEIIPGNGYSPHTGYTVFRAWDKELKRNVVVKYGGLPKNFHSTLCEEYLMISNLSNMSVIRVYDYKELYGRGFIVMPDHRLGGRRSRWRIIFSAQDEIGCRAFIKNLLLGLFYLRTMNVLHEDVEMANLVATYPHVPIIIDFGRARKVVYSRGNLVEMLHPDNKTRVNAWVRELCGIGGKYAEEGAMMNFDVRETIIKKLGDVYNGFNRTR